MGTKCLQLKSSSHAHLKATSTPKGEQRKKKERRKEREEFRGKRHEGNEERNAGMLEKRAIKRTKRPNFKIPLKSIEKSTQAPHRLFVLHKSAGHLNWKWKW